MMSNFEKSSRFVNMMGRYSPEVELEVKRYLKTMKDWDVIEILTDDQVSVNKTLPYICEKRGFRYEITNEGWGLWKVLIEKTALRGGDRTLDLRGRFSPITEKEVMEGIRGLEKGMILAIILDDEVSVKNTLPLLCKRMNYRWRCFRLNDHWKFLIEKA